MRSTLVQVGASIRVPELSTALVTTRNATGPGPGIDTLQAHSLQNDAKNTYIVNQNETLKKHFRI